MRTRIFLLLLTSVLLMAEQPRRRLVVLGDSIAAGHGLDPDQAFPALLQKKIDAAGLGYEVVNAGVSGDTTAGGVRRISWLLRQPIDVLLIELGGNDGLRGITPAETERNLQTIMEKARARYPEMKIVVAGMQMPPSMGAEFTQKFRALFGEVAGRNNAVLIPFLLEGVGGRRDLNQEDRIHPTPQGQEIVANTVWKILEPVLKS